MAASSEKSRMVVRKARPRDAKQIAGIIGTAIQSTSEVFGSMQICSCSGYHNYIEDNIRMESLGANKRYFVCEEDDVILGCTEVKLLLDGLNNNYTGKDFKFADRKVGKLLKYYAIKMLSRSNHEYVTGDVLVSNSNSTGFHRSIGFEEVSRHSLYLLAIPEVRVDNNYIVLEYAQSEAIHARYGFSQFVVETTAGRYTVGRIGDSVFRMSGSTWWDDASAASALRHLGPGRRVLATAELSASGASVLPGEPLDTSVRFRMPRDKYLKVLEVLLERAGYLGK